MGTDSNLYSLKPIGYITTCFKEKFGAPRQAGLVPEARGALALLEDYSREEAWRGIEDFSHVWVIFMFHANRTCRWKPTVRPPRLGGNRRVGVFASRSGFRPNPIGLSAVELTGQELRGSQLILHLKGVDMVEGTPVLDVKPYLPYADIRSAATGGFAHQAPGRSLAVRFSSRAGEFCKQQQRRGLPHLDRLIREVLAADPRPAYYSRRPVKKSVGMKLHDFEIKWQVAEGQILVTDIKPSPPDRCDGAVNLKHETRNPKSETNSKF